MNIFWENPDFQTEGVFPIQIKVKITPQIILSTLKCNSMTPNLKSTQAKSYVLRRVLVELPRPSALGKRIMHFPFEIIIWDTKVV
jgi:hypothetical protein